MLSACGGGISVVERSAGGCRRRRGRFGMRNLKFGVLGLGLMAAALGLAPGAWVQEKIGIAVAGPMTGQYAAFGEQMRRGAAMAVADINAAGGILGKQLQLEVGDDACDPKQAVAVANQLASKGVVFVA